MNFSSNYSTTDDTISELESEPKDIVYSGMKRKHEETIAKKTKCISASNDLPFKLKGDFREDAVMTLNNMVGYVNQGRASALKNLLLNHCAPDVELTLKYKSSNACPYSHSTFVEVCGPHAVALFCESYLVAIPDTRMSIQETKSKVLASGLLTLNCRYAFTGTKTLSLSTDKCNSLVVSDMSKLLANKAGDNILVYAIEGENRHKIIRNSHNGKKDDGNVQDRLIVGAMAQPQILKLFGAVYMTLNPATGQITKLLMTHSHKKR